MRICIEVSGAMVQNVYAIGGDCDVEIFDFDLDEDWEETDESIESDYTKLTNELKKYISVFC